MRIRDRLAMFGEAIKAGARAFTRLAKAAMAPEGWQLRDEYEEQIVPGRSGQRDLKATPRQLPELYELDLWVHACVSRKAEVIADLPWVIRRETGGAEDEIVAEHPALDFLWEPGKEQTWTGLIFSAVAQLSLGGRNYVEIVRDGKKGPPTALVPLLPHMTRPRVDKEKGIVGFTYKPNRDEQFFDAEQVLYWQEFSPLEEYGSVSPARAAWLSTQLDLDARRWNQLFFARSAVPETVFELNKPITRAERERIEKEFEEMHAGLAKGRGVHVMPPDVKVHTLASSHRDMQFIQLADVSRKEIMAAFGIPPIWLGIETANYATAMIQERVAIRRVCIPMWQRIAAVMTKKLLPMFEDNEGLYLAIDEQRLDIPEERAARHASVIEDLASQIISRDEARSLLGYGVAEDRGEPPAKGARATRESKAPEPEQEEGGEGQMPGGGGRNPFAGRAGGQKAKDAAEAAKKGLELLAKIGRPTTGTAIAIARKLAAQEPLNGHSAIVRSFHARQTAAVMEKRASIGAWGDEDDPSPEWVAWLLYGGEAGADLVRKER